MTPATMTSVSATSPKKPRPLVAEYCPSARLARSHSDVAATSRAIATFQW